MSNKICYEAIKFEKDNWKNSFVIQDVVSIVCLVILILVILLAYYEMFSNVSITVDIFGVFGFTYMGFLLSLVGCVWYVTIDIPEPFYSLAEGRLGRFFGMILGLFGLNLLLAGAIFSGLPSVLHHLTSQEGSVTLTVSRKSNATSRYTCSPALYMQEFTWFFTKPICPEYEVYEVVQVGDVVHVTGQVSAFGVKAEYVSLMK